MLLVFSDLNHGLKACLQRNCYYGCGKFVKLVRQIKIMVILDQWISVNISQILNCIYCPIN